MVDEENIFWLEIGVNEVQVVQERYAAQKLPRKGLNMRSWEWHEATLLEEVKDAQSKQRCNDTYVASPVETVHELNTSVSILVIGSSKCLQDSEFNTAGISVL